MFSYQSIFGQWLPVNNRISPFTLQSNVGYIFCGTAAPTPRSKRRNHTEIKEGTAFFLHLNKAFNIADLTEKLRVSICMILHERKPASITVTSSKSVHRHYEEVDLLKKQRLVIILLHCLTVFSYLTCMVSSSLSLWPNSLFVQFASYLRVKDMTTEHCKCLNTSIEWLSCHRLCQQTTVWE